VGDRGGAASDELVKFGRTGVPFAGDNPSTDQSFYNEEEV